MTDYSEPALNLVEAPVLAPQETTIDAAQIAQMQEELNAAQQMELPEEEGDAF